MTESARASSKRATSARKYSLRAVVVMSDDEEVAPDLAALLPTLRVVNLRLPLMSMARGEAESKAHFKQMISVQKEVIGTIVINSFFQMMHVLPMAYLGT
mgnify:CR=1 FL=1